MQSLKKTFIYMLMPLGLFFILMPSANAQRAFKPPPWMSAEIFYAILDLEGQAEQGDVEMQNLVADIYYTGNYLGEEVHEDHSRAFRLYQKAANQGHAGAQTSLAIMYQEGEVVRQSLTEHIKWLKKAAVQKNSCAQFQLGIAYEFGSRGVNQDYAIAKEWYGKSCDNGKLDGCHEYKRLNEQGR